MNLLRHGALAFTLVLIFLLSSSVSAGTAPASRPESAKAVLLCAGNTRVKTRAMKDDLRVVRSRLRGAYGAQSRRVTRAGGRCIRVAIPGIRRAVLRQAIQPGDVALADGGRNFLNPGTNVRLKCRLGVCPPGFVRSATAHRGRAHPLLRVVVAGSMVVRGTAVLGRSRGNGWTVAYTLTRQGNRLWCSYTRGHIDEFAAIVLDGTIVEDPTVESAICGRQSLVSLGSYAVAHWLVMYLNSGPLIVPLHVVS